MKAVVLLLVQLAALHGVGHAVPIGAVPEPVSHKDIRNGISWDHRQTRKEYRHHSIEKTEVPKRRRLPRKEVNRDGYDKIADGVKDVVGKSTTEYKENTKQSSKGGIGGATNDDWSVFTEQSTEDWISGKEETTVANKDFTNGVTDEVDQRTTHNPEATDGFSDEGVVGETTEELDEFTKETTEDSMPRVDVTTADYEDFTDGLNEKLDQSTTEHPEQTSEFSYAGVKEKNTDNSVKFTEEPTEVGMSGVEVNTEDYDDFTDGVTDEFDQNTTEHGELTHELSDEGVGGKTTNDSGEFTEGSTEDWLPGVDVTTEHFDNFTDGVTKESSQSTTEYTEHTNEFSDGGYGGSSSKDYGEFTEGSTENWLPGVDVTTEHFDDFTDGVTDEFGHSTTEYPEHTNEFSDGGIGGSTSEDSGEFTEGSTEDWFPGVDVTTEHFDDFTDGVTDEFGQSTTEYPEHTNEFSDIVIGGESTVDSGESTQVTSEGWFSSEEVTTVAGGDFTHGMTEEFGQSTTESPEHTYELSDGVVGGGTKDDSDKSTHVTPEDWFSLGEVTTEAFDVFTVGVTDEIDVSTTEYHERTDEFTHDLSVTESDNISGMYTNLTTVGMAVEPLVSLGDLDQFLPRNFGA